MLLVPGRYVRSGLNATAAFTGVSHFNALLRRVLVKKHSFGVARAHHKTIAAGTPFARLEGATVPYAFVGESKHARQKPRSAAARATTEVLAIAAR